MRLALELVTVIAGAFAMLVTIPRAARRQRAKREPPRPLRPVDLERLERLVVTGPATAGSVHARLRPVLREVAAARLRRRGVGLDRSPQEARQLLGDELWELVRMDRPRPSDTRAPGMSFDQLASVIERLERL